MCFYTIQPVGDKTVVRLLFNITSLFTTFSYVNKIFCFIISYYTLTRLTMTTFNNLHFITFKYSLL